VKTVKDPETVRGVLNIVGQPLIRTAENVRVAIEINQTCKRTLL
jgi:hypothetical protein